MDRPSSDVLSWVAGALGVPGVTAAPLGDGGPWLVTADPGGRRAVLALGDPGDHAVRQRFATEAAALELAARHAVPAPRPIAADLDATTTGELALLTSFLPGSSRIPAAADERRLRELGAGVAQIHRVTTDPTAALPRRTMSLEGLDLSIAPPSRATERLLAQAHDAVRTRGAPEEPAVLVHGDLWQGNTMWDAERYVAAVDWDYAGIGPAGVDLGSLRCDVALFFDVPAADVVLEGWRGAADAPDIDVAWWDVVAALSTPPDLVAWLPNLHAQGRTDLDAATVNARRDAFLAAALRALG